MPDQRPPLRRCLPGGPVQAEGAIHRRPGDSRRAQPGVSGECVYQVSKSLIVRKGKDLINISLLLADILAKLYD